MEDKAGVEIDVDLMLRYIARLETAIITAAAEFQPGGDAGYGQRLIAMMAARITASLEAAERSATATAERAATRH